MHTLLAPTLPSSKLFLTSLFSKQQQTRRPSKRLTFTQNRTTVNSSINTSALPPEAMKPMSIEVVASSDIYRFVVGPEKKVYHVHSAVLAHHSPALEAMVNGEFRESVEKMVDWTDVDPTAFLGLWQFLYRGEYGGVVLSSKAEEDVPEIESEEKEEQEKRECPLTHPMSRLMWSILDIIPLEDPEVPPLPRQPKAAGSRVVVNAYADLLLQHARVQIHHPAPEATLSESPSKGVEESCARQATRKKVAPDIMALLKYCFDNPTPEQLRELVCVFTTCFIRQLWWCEGFQDLLESSGEMSKGILTCIVPNLDGWTRF
ncbi:unnamed protein product [Clonostachys rosea]|uniref:BTB domain-containing protein n=1 Tax=Bionectria ochroleuca TaxID=29856 RepID=A0ABY6U4J8_BIOOC|nr:unnamed protein product [Clonostachys rosea]